MFFLLGGNEKKTRKPAAADDGMSTRVKELFLSGKFPVVTTDMVEGKQICKVLGLVCCRGYDSEEAFFGMASRAVGKGAHAIVGYMENVAFHPDGSKYFCCYGTAVMFAWEPEEKFGAAALWSGQRDGVVPDVSGVRDVNRIDAQWSDKKRIENLAAESLRDMSPDMGDEEAPVRLRRAASREEEELAGPAVTTRQWRVQ